jgi:hypothetical protein
MTLIISPGGPMRLAKFADVRGKDIYVNAERVTYVSVYTPSVTIIHFGPEDSVSVKLEMSQVVSLLFNAGRA